jgi:hypothetical protein
LGLFHGHGIETLEVGRRDAQVSVCEVSVDAKPDFILQAVVHRTLQRILDGTDA